MKLPNVKAVSENVSPLLIPHIAYKYIRTKIKLLLLVMSYYFSFRKEIIRSTSILTIRLRTSLTYVIPKPLNTDRDEFKRRCVVTNFVH